MVDQELPRQEFANHLRKVSSRLNGMIPYLMPEHHNLSRWRSAGWSMSEYMKLPDSKRPNCARVMVVGSGEWTSIKLIAWNRRSICFSYSTNFTSGKFASSHCHLYHHCFAHEEVTRALDGASAYSAKIKRLRRILRPLAPLFSTEKMLWFAGFAALDDLERKAAAYMENAPTVASIIEEHKRSKRRRKPRKGAPACKNGIE